MPSRYEPRPQPYGYSSYQGGDRILDLIMRGGQIQAEGAQRGSEIWGQALSGIGQTIATGFEQYGEAKKKEEEKVKLKARDAAFASAVESWDGKNPNALLSSLTMFPPDERIKKAEAIVAFRNLSATSDEKEVQKIAAEVARMDDPLLERWGPGMQARIAPYLVRRYGGTAEQYTQPIPPAQFRQLAQSIAGGEGFTLGENQVRFGPNGQRIAAGPVEAPTPPNLQHVETAQGIQSFNPREGTLGPVLAQGRPAQGPAPERPGWQWVLRNGQHVQIRQGQAQPGDVPASNREQSSTGAEKTALSFYNDARQAANDADAVADKLGNSFQLKYAPNIAQTEEQQQYWQAVRSFTEARLRKRSGAAIPEYEIEKDAKMYFQQPGDSDAVKKQKKASRERTIDGIRIESGRAYAEYYGEPVPRNQPGATDPAAGTASPIPSGATPGAGPAAGGRPAPPTQGERRTINGQLAEWDGRGWLPVRR